ncbi:amino acid adenylation domain-containing protein [Streptomyces luteireticuli]|uniref:amino acid adenylation domain-containing protein n=1 Tax=Streptomyces luteireticuli TaxID=173858 RepID=UPI0035578F82
MSGSEVLSGRCWPGVPEQIACWSSATPDAPAVVQGERTWSYRQLADSVGALTTELERAGLGAGQVVAVTGPRDFRLVAAWVAVLARRCVLFPVDPALPLAFRQQVLGRAGAAVVLALDDMSAAGYPAVPCLRVPRGGLPDGAGRGVRMSPPGAEEPGYVFFTSGSTGVPKAVLGRHRSLAHFLSWMRSALAVGPGDRMPHLASPGFDVSLREVFLPLVSGATLCLPPPGSLPPARVLPWLQANRVTLLPVVPTVARAWLHATRETVRLEGLRTVLFSGEPLNNTLVERLRAQLDYRGAVINLYGPTETTLVRCWHTVTHPVPGIQPLGRAIPGSQVWVEQAPGAPAPVGEVGEIVLRTVYGTSGYLGATPSEAARFSFGPGGEVVYRTGDLGRMDAGGLLHFLGRTDDQVKIYGVRLHLRAVEAVLEAQVGIDQAAVTAEQGRDGDPPRLTARLVLAPGRAEVPRGLRRALLDHLPAAAVPAHLIAVSALPQTATSGKLDRSRLANKPFPPSS